MARTSGHRGEGEEVERESDMKETPMKIGFIGLGIK